MENKHLAITDDQVAVFRAYLRGESEKFSRLNGMLDRSKDSARSYQALMVGLFVKAIFIRFDERTSRDTVAAYVAELWSRSERIANRLDPETAVRVIMAVIGDENTDGITAEEKIGVEMTLIAGCVADAKFTPTRRELFLERAREFGDSLLS